MTRLATIAALLTAAAIFAAPYTASAQGRGMRTGGGPVVSACQHEIARYCGRLSHGGGEVRACLNAKRWKLSHRCKWALDHTGGGRGWR